MRNTTHTRTDAEKTTEEIEVAKGKVAVKHKKTGEIKWHWYPDAREMVASGEYETEVPIVPLPAA